MPASAPASARNYDGTALAAKGVVVVTVNYRGGPLGLLATPELSKESGHNASGDYSLMDDIAALKWVQKNIAAFGGDPKNVTIFGQSWGSGTEHFLSLSPLAKGLFHRMINQSHARYPRDPELFAIAGGYRRLAGSRGGRREVPAGAGREDLAELRALPWQKLIEAYQQPARTCAGPICSTAMSCRAATRTPMPPPRRPMCSRWPAAMSTRAAPRPTRPSTC